MSSPYEGKRNPGPCIDCRDRKIACSDHCDRYKAWKGEVNRIKENRRAYMNQRSWDAKAAFRRKRKL